MSLIKKIVVFGFAVVVLMLGLWLTAIWRDLIYTPLLRGQQKSIAIKVQSGTGIHTLARILHQTRLVRYPRLFILLAKINGDAPKLKAGEYQITPTMTAPDLLANIVAGKVMQRSITFIEGWTFRQIKQALDENTHIQHTIVKMSNTQIMKQLGHPQQYPEGMFFPDTYYFTWGDNDIEVLKTAYARMQNILEKQWLQRASGLPYKKPYQALIVASLIEKETALPEERRLVAGVIARRLKKHMRLQVDPTVLYGLGRAYGSVIMQEDLDLYTPYNTYQRYGLPPTPIDMPGRASILAALHPAHGDALYYVARGDGSHQFSATYKQHQKAVKKYLHRESTDAGSSKHIR